MSRPFEDHVALVTGASSGIGVALCRELSRQGARVVLAARRVDRLMRLAEELGGPGRALAVACDVTKDGAPEAAVARAVGEWGRLDVVIANAGFGVGGRFEKLTLDDFRRQFETNVFGVLRTVKAGLPEIRKSRGRIAIVGSVNGSIATPITTPYCMSKFSVRALALGLSAELAKDGVSVTHLAPGFVESEIRAVDNQGVYREGSKDPVPKWLAVPAATAAREMVRAIAKRRRDRVITFHGKVLVLLERCCPALVAFLLRRAGRVRPGRGRAGS